MAEDLIRYDLLVQDALRGVVRRVLTDAAREGLSGEHHFYVSFRTEAPGVRMSQRLREKYPQEMTIVLQHQFWDLGVTETTFEVGLSFSGVPERLLVPFDALSGFFDPSVQFGLKFDLNEEVAADEAEPVQPKNGPRGAASEPGEVKPKGTGLAAIPGGPKIVPALPVAGNARSDPAKLVPAKVGGRADATLAAKSGTGKSEVAKSEAEKSETGKPDGSGEDKPGSEKDAGAAVVSLDAFRKKN